MKTLIVDDDFTNRLIIQQILKPYGNSHIAVNGKEAVEAVRNARESGAPYDLVILDIMMPGMDGQEALKVIRADEEKDDILLGDGVKIVMATALDDGKNIMSAFGKACDGYVVKPIQKDKLLEILRNLVLIT